MRGAEGDPDREYAQQSQPVAGRRKVGDVPREHLADGALHLDEPLQHR
jgi:hypothetical protein